MAIAVYLVRKNGERERLGDYDALGEAAGYALSHADAIGRHAGQGHEPAERVDIERDGRLELSIQIIGGGLLPARDAP